MDGIFDDRSSKAANIAGLIREHHSGCCSGAPSGVRYPNVPSVEEIAARAGVTLDDAAMTEDEWFALYVRFMFECIANVTARLDPGNSQQLLHAQFRCGSRTEELWNDMTKAVQG